MFKRDWIAAVVSALVFCAVLSLAATAQASAKQTVEVVDKARQVDSVAPLASDTASFIDKHGKATNKAVTSDGDFAAQRNKQQPRTSTFDQAVAATLKAQIK
jgi:uncharacterized protein YdaL